MIKQDIALPQYWDDEKAGCLECSRAIPDLACPQCIADEFISWMDNYPRLKGKTSMIKQVSYFIKFHKNLEGNSERCVECHKDNVYMCPYCFTTFLWTIVKKNIVSKKITGEFLRLFNFDHYHNGYYKFREKLEN